MAKLILTNEVTGLGSAGDVVEVKNGYARNYLIPQGYAVAWTRGGEKQVEQIKAARAAREHATIEEAQDLKARLDATLGTAGLSAWSSWCECIYRVEPERRRRPYVDSRPSGAAMRGAFRMSGLRERG